MKYVVAAQTTELSDGRKKIVSLEGKEILLANVGNAYYAVDNRCPHMGGSLFEGTLDDGLIICPKHGSVFDIKTGKAVVAGKILFFRIKVDNLHSYPVKIEGTDVLIGME